MKINAVLKLIPTILTGFLGIFFGVKMIGLERPGGFYLVVPIIFFNIGAFILTYKIFANNKNKNLNNILLSVCAYSCIVMVCLAESTQKAGGWLAFPILFITGFFWLIAIIADIGALIRWFFSLIFNQIKQAHASNQANAQIRRKSTMPQISQRPTQILEAVLSGKVEQIQAALVTNPSQLNTPYIDNGNTPLHVAVWNGNKDIVELLLAQPGIDVQVRNKANKTALDLAKEKNLTEIIEMLKFAEQR